MVQRSDTLSTSASLLPSRSFYFRSSCVFDPSEWYSA